MSVTELADQIGHYSVLLLWAALSIRAIPALKSRHQRGLWLAILTAAIATTLFQPEVIDWAIAVTGDAHAVTLSRNLIGVLSAGVTLLFIVDSVGGRQLRVFIAIGLLTSLTCLLGMDLAEDEYPGPGIPASAGPAAPSVFYWLIVCVAHLVTDGVAAIVCWRYCQDTRDRDLAWSLRLFALGSVLAIAFWGAYLVHLGFRMPKALPYMSVIMGLHGVSRAFTLVVPTATAAIRFTRNVRTVWVLWPMWRDLLTAVPGVALVEPQQTRIREVLRPRGPMALQAHRQTIETYDAILGLQSHVRPEAYAQVLRQAQRISTPAKSAAAAALAGALGQARRAKLVGEPTAGPHPLPGLDRCDEALLLAIARSWPCMSGALPVNEPGHQRPVEDHRSAGDALT